MFISDEELRITRQESEPHRKAINYISGNKNRDSVHKITNNFTLLDTYAPYRKLQ